MKLYVGSPGTPGETDGTGTTARFLNPDQVIVNADGSVVSVAEPGSCRVRLISSGGVVTTVGTSGC